MKRWTVLSLLSVGVSLCLADPCNIYINDSPTPLTDWVQGTQLATFKKNVPTGEILPGNIKLTPNLHYLELTVPFTQLCKADYFDVIVGADNTFTFQVTDNFQNLDEDTMQDNVVDDRCSLQLKLDTTECDSSLGNFVNVKYTVEDYNAHQPEFINGPYSIKMSSPLMNDLSLSQVSGTYLVAQDLDFSTSSVTFSVEGDERFEVRMTEVQAQRQFRAQLFSKQVVFLQEDLVLNLVVDDGGIDPGPLQGRTSLTIQPDPNTSFPPKPVFSQPLYLGDIDFDEIQLDSVLPVDIQLEQAYRDLAVEVLQTSGDPEEHFRADAEGGMGPGIQLFYVKEFTPDETPIGVLTVLVRATVSTFGKAAEQSVVVQLTFTGTTTTTATTTTTGETDPDSPPTTTTTTGETDPDSPPTTTTTTGETDPDSPPTSSTTSTTEETPLPGNSDGDDPGMMIGLIVVAVLAGVLAVGMGFMYFKCIRGRNHDQDRKLLIHEETGEELPKQETSRFPKHHFGSMTDNSKAEDEGGSNLQKAEDKVTSMEIEKTKSTETEKTTPTETEAPTHDLNSYVKNLVEQTRMMDDLESNKATNMETGESSSSGGKEATNIEDLLEEEPRSPISLDSLVMEHENSLKPEETKTRKRSQTFSVTDEEARLARESTDEVLSPKPVPVRKKSVVTFQGLE